MNESVRVARRRRMTTKTITHDEEGRGPAETEANVVGPDEKRVKASNEDRWKAKDGVMHLVNVIPLFVVAAD